MQKLSEYIPPKVWKWDKENNTNRFSNINRPLSGATSDKVLPRGVHPIQLYSVGTPNGVKVTIMLEELLESGCGDAEYDAWLINILEGDQFTSGFVDVNPNSKIPALVDFSIENEPQKVFESGSILFYLAEKFDCFLPKKRKERQLDVLDKRLKENEFIVGSELTIADFAIYPWYGAMVRGLLYDAKDFLEVESYSHLMRWTKQLSERSAFKRGQIVNRAWDLEKGIKERHSSADFDGKI